MEWSISNLGKFENVKLDYGKNKPSLIAVNSHECIAIFEQGKMSRIAFYNNAFFEGSFKINTDINVINISNNILMLEQDISKADINEFKYIAHNMLNNESFSFVSKQRLICASLNSEAILTYLDGELKLSNSILLNSLCDITTMTSYSYYNSDYVVAFGSKNGEVSISNLKKLENKWNLNKIKVLANFNGIVTNLVFADANTLIVIIDNEEMYVLKIDSCFKIINEALDPLKLKILCKGMKIDNLKSDTEYNFLKKLITAAEQGIVES